MSDPAVFIPPETLRPFTARLLGWFARHGRDLPWRHTRDPYAIWVSEVMLQQTTTETVRSYFGRFLSRFPDVFALARAGDEEVLSLWQGLGYYRRALLTRRAACRLAEQFGGKFPRTIDGLLALPGIGRYSAGAIRSLAFDLPSPILEANTRRLYARLAALTLDAASPAGEKLLWRFAESILPSKNGRDFTLALMDLGSLVCGTIPRCGRCPVRRFCAASAAGKENTIPVLSPKKEKIPRQECALFIRHPGTRGKEPLFLFVQYPNRLRWGGLWDFPRFEFPVGDAPDTSAKLREAVSAFLGNPPLIAPPLWRLRHSVTRYTIDLFFCPVGLKRGGRLKQDFWRGKDDRPIRFAGGQTTFGAVQFRWLTLDQARGLAMSTTGR
ncbi:MAG: A/G-specific adenine glycosylase, partial [Thermoguttaceae bacterium]|nr:A/G-specific adenine glycosylase [Thermoguttaceae bacterium]